VCVIIVGVGIAVVSVSVCLDVLIWKLI